ncbi:hypothetical protein FDG2_3274 [Candidatus Protofrankia californiensis]|uniref:Uncharacterized protein n=1 Tax=Candidatus Protofrankia californiensis TaxID=1839754 RepID=A0A1C3NZC2_9ACTN|nr:hypothetical protein FDG2_3274 [Candidatus Protofrankia californiensis]
MNTEIQWRICWEAQLTPTDHVEPAERETVCRKEPEL